MKLHRQIDVQLPKLFEQSKKYITRYNSIRNKDLPFYYCTFSPNSIAIMQYFNRIGFY